MVKQWRTVALAWNSCELSSEGLFIQLQKICCCWRTLIWTTIQQCTVNEVLNTAKQYSAVERMIRQYLSIQSSISTQTYFSLDNIPILEKAFLHISPVFLVHHLCPQKATPQEFADIPACQFSHHSLWAFFGSSYVVFWWKMYSSSQCVLHNNLCYITICVS